MPKLLVPVPVLYTVRGIRTRRSRLHQFPSHYHPATRASVQTLQYPALPSLDSVQYTVRESIEYLTCPPQISTAFSVFKRLHLCILSRKNPSITQNLYKTTTYYGVLHRLLTEHGLAYGSLSRLSSPVSKPASQAGRISKGLPTYLVCCRTWLVYVRY